MLTSVGLNLATGIHAKSPHLKSFSPQSDSGEGFFLSPCNWYKPQTDRNVHFIEINHLFLIVWWKIPKNTSVTHYIMTLNNNELKKCQSLCNKTTIPRNRLFTKQFYFWYCLPLYPVSNLFQGKKSIKNTNFSLFFNFFNYSMHSSYKVHTVFTINEQILKWTLKCGRLYEGTHNNTLFTINTYTFRLTQSNQDTNILSWVETDTNKKITTKSFTFQLWQFSHGEYA